MYSILTAVGKAHLISSTGARPLLDGIAVCIPL